MKTMNLVPDLFFPEFLISSTLINRFHVFMSIITSHIVLLLLRSPHSIIRLYSHLMVVELVEMVI